jgi:hypothetical protein
VASSISELVVRIGADTKGATSGLHLIQSNIRQLQSIAGQASGPLGSMFEAISKATFQVGLAAFGVNALAESVTLLANSLLGSNAQFETYNMQLEVMFRNMVATQDAAKGLGATVGDQMREMAAGANLAQQELDRLFVFAAKTPFELPELVQADRILMVFGLHAQELTDTLTRVGNAAAVANRGYDEIAVHIGRVYTAIQAGRPAGRSLFALQQFGVLSGEARNQIEALQKSGASSEKVWAVMTDALDRFAGAMDRMQGTFRGMAATFSDVGQLLMRSVTQPLFAAVENTMRSVLGDILSTNYETATEAVQTWRDAAQELGNRVGVFLAVLQARFSFLGEAVGPAIHHFVQNIRGALEAGGDEWERASTLSFTRIVVAIGRAADAILPAVAIAIGDVIPLITNQLNQVTPAVEKILDSIAPRFATFVAVVGQPLVGAFLSFYTSIVQTLANISPAIGVLLGRVTPIVRETADLFTSLLPGAVRIASQAFNTLIAPAALSIADLFESRLLPTVRRTADWLSGFLTVAIYRLGVAWRSVVPTVGAVASFFERTLIPTVQRVAEWISANLPRAAAALDSVVRQSLLPVFQSLADLFNNALLPAFQAVFGVILAVGPGVLRTFRDAWLTIEPAIEAFVRALGTLVPILTFLGGGIFSSYLVVLPLLATLLGTALVAGVSKLSNSLSANLAPALNSVGDRILRNNQLFKDMQATVSRPVGQAGLGLRGTEAEAMSAANAVRFMAGSVREGLAGAWGRASSAVDGYAGRVAGSSAALAAADPGSRLARGFATGFAAIESGVGRLIDRTNARFTGLGISSFLQNQAIAAFSVRYAEAAERVGKAKENQARAELELLRAQQMVSRAEDTLDKQLERTNTLVGTQDALATRLGGTYQEIAGTVGRLNSAIESRALFQSAGERQIDLTAQVQAAVARIQAQEARETEAIQAELAGLRTAIIDDGAVGQLPSALGELSAQVAAANAEAQKILAANKLALDDQDRVIRAGPKGGLVAKSAIPPGVEIARRELLRAKNEFNEATNQGIDLGGFDRQLGAINKALARFENRAATTANLIASLNKASPGQSIQALNELAKKASAAERAAAGVYSMPKGTLSDLEAQRDAIKAEVLSLERTVKAERADLGATIARLRTELAAGADVRPLLTQETEALRSYVKAQEGAIAQLEADYVRAVDEGRQGVAGALERSASTWNELTNRRARLDQAGGFRQSLAGFEAQLREVDKGRTLTAQQITALIDRYAQRVLKEDPSAAEKQVLLLGRNLTRLRGEIKTLQEDASFRPGDLAGQSLEELARRTVFGSQAIFDEWVGLMQTAVGRIAPVVSAGLDDVIAALATREVELQDEVAKNGLVPALEAQRLALAAELDRAKADVTARMTELAEVLELKGLKGTPLAIGAVQIPVPDLGPAVRDLEAQEAAMRGRIEEAVVALGNAVGAGRAGVSAALAEVARKVVDTSAPNFVERTLAGLRAALGQAQAEARRILDDNAIALNSLGKAYRPQATGAGKKGFVGESELQSIGYRDAQANVQRLQAAEAEYEKAAQRGLGFNTFEEQLAGINAALAKFAGEEAEVQKLITQIAAAKPGLPPELIRREAEASASRAAATQLSGGVRAELEASRSRLEADLAVQHEVLAKAAADVQAAMTAMRETEIAAFPTTPERLGLEAQQANLVRLTSTLTAVLRRRGLDVQAAFRDMESGIAGAAQRFQTLTIESFADSAALGIGNNQLADVRRKLNDIAAKEETSRRVLEETIGAYAKEQEAGGAVAIAQRAISQLESGLASVRERFGRLEQGEGQALAAQVRAGLEAAVAGLGAQLAAEEGALLAAKAKLDEAVAAERDRKVAALDTTALIPKLRAEETAIIESLERARAELALHGRRVQEAAEEARRGEIGALTRYETAYTEAGQASALVGALTQQAAAVRTQLQGIEATRTTQLAQIEADLLIYAEKAVEGAGVGPAERAIAELQTSLLGVRERLSGMLTESAASIATMLAAPVDELVKREFFATEEEFTQWRAFLQTEQERLGEVVRTGLAGALVALAEGDDALAAELGRRGPAALFQLHRSRLEAELGTIQADLEAARTQMSRLASVGPTVTAAGPAAGQAAAATVGVAEIDGQIAKLQALIKTRTEDVTAIHQEIAANEQLLTVAEGLSDREAQAVAGAAQYQATANRANLDATNATRRAQAQRWAEEQAGLTRGITAEQLRQRGLEATSFSVRGVVGAINELQARSILTDEIFEKLKYDAIGMAKVISVALEEDVAAGRKLATVLAEANGEMVPGRIQGFVTGLKGASGALMTASFAMFGLTSLVTTFVPEARGAMDAINEISFALVALVPLLQLIRTEALMTAAALVVDFAPFLIGGAIVLGIAAIITHLGDIGSALHGMTAEAQDAQNALIENKAWEDYWSDLPLTVETSFQKAADKVKEGVPKIEAAMKGTGGGTGPGAESFSLQAQAQSYALSLPAAAGGNADQVIDNGQPTTRAGAAQNYLERQAAQNKKDYADFVQNQIAKNGVFAEEYKKLGDDLYNVISQGNQTAADRLAHIPPPAAQESLDQLFGWISTYTEKASADELRKVNVTLTGTDANIKELLNDNGGAVGKAIRDHLIKQNQVALDVFNYWKTNNQRTDIDPAAELVQKFGLKKFPSYLAQEVQDAKGALHEVAITDPLALNQLGQNLAAGLFTLENTVPEQYQKLHNELMVRWGLMTGNAFRDLSGAITGELKDITPDEWIRQMFQAATDTQEKIETLKAAFPALRADAATPQEEDRQAKQIFQLLGRYDKAARSAPGPTGEAEDALKQQETAIKVVGGIAKDYEQALSDFAVTMSRLFAFVPPDPKELERHMGDFMDALDGVFQPLQKEALNFKDNIGTIVAFADALDKVFKAFDDALSFFDTFRQKMSDWKSKGSGLKEDISSFGTMLIQIMGDLNTQMLASFKSIKTDDQTTWQVVPLLGSLGEAMSGVFKGLSDAVDLFKKVQEVGAGFLKPGQMISGQVTILESIVGDLLNHFKDNITPTEQATAVSVKEAAEAIGSIFQAYGTVLDFFVKLTEVGAKVVARASDTVGHASTLSAWTTKLELVMDDILRHMGENISQAARDAAKNNKEFADNLSSVFKGLSDAYGFFEKLAATGAKVVAKSGEFDHWITLLTPHITHAVEEFKRIVPAGYATDAALDNYAKSVSASFQAFEAVYGLSEKMAATGRKTFAAYGSFSGWISKLAVLGKQGVASFKAVEAGTEEDAKLMQAWGAAGGAVFEALARVYDLMQKMANTASAVLDPSNNLLGNLKKIGSIMADVVKQLGAQTGSLGDPEGAQAYGNAASALFEALAKSFDLMEKVAVSGRAVLSHASDIADVFKQIGDIVVQVMAGTFKRVSQATLDASADMQAYAGATSSLFDAVVKAYDFFLKLIDTAGKWRSKSIELVTVTNEVLLKMQTSYGYLIQILFANKDVWFSFAEPVQKMTAALGSMYDALNKAFDFFIKLIDQGEKIHSYSGRLVDETNAITDDLVKVGDHFIAMTTDKGAIRTITDGALAYAQYVQAAFQALATALDFFLKLIDSQAKLRSAAATMLSDATGLEDTILKVMQKWSDISPESAEKDAVKGWHYDRMQTFAQTTQAVFAAMQASLDFFTKVADVGTRILAPANTLAATTGRLEAAILEVMTAWRTISPGSGAGPKGSAGAGPAWNYTPMEDFARVTGEVFTALTSAFDYFTKLSTTGTYILGQMDAFVSFTGELETRIESVLRSFQAMTIRLSAALPDPTVLEPFAQAVSAVFSSLGQAFDVLMKFAQGGAVLNANIPTLVATTETIQKGVDSVMDKIRQIVTDSDKPWHDTLSKEVQAFGQAVGAVADALLKAISLLSTLSQSTTVFDAAPLLAKVDSLKNGVAALMAAIASIAADPRVAGQAKNLTDFGGGVLKIVESIEKVMELFTRLDVYDTRAYDLADKVLMLLRAINRILFDVRTAVSPENLAFAAGPSLGPVADASAKVIDSLMRALDLFDRLTGRSFDFTAVRGAVDQIITGIDSIMTELRTKIGAGWADLGEGAFADSAVKVLTSISDGFTLFKTVGENTARVANSIDMGKIVAQVIGVYRRFREELRTQLNAIDLGSYSIVAGQVGAIAENISKSIKALADGLDFIMKLDDASVTLGYGDPLAFLGPFFDDLGRVLSAFKAKATQFAADMTGPVLDAADDLSKAMGALKSALDFLTGLFDYRPSGAGRIDAFFTSLGTVLERIGELSVTLTDQTVMAARRIGENFGPAMSVLKDALGIFKELSGETESETTTETTGNGRRQHTKTTTRSTSKSGFLAPVNPEAVRNFVSSLRALLAELDAQMSGPIVEQALATARNISARLGPAMDAISKAVGIFTALLGDETTETETSSGSKRSHTRTKTSTKKGIGGVTTEEIKHFIDNLVFMLNYWATLVNNPAFGGNFQERSDAFAYTVGNILGALQGVIEAMQGVNNLTGGGQIDIGAIFNQLTSGFLDFIGRVAPQLATLADPGSVGSIVSLMFKSWDPKLPGSIPSIWGAAWTQMADVTERQVARIVSALSDLPAGLQATITVLASPTSGPGPGTVSTGRSGGGRGSAPPSDGGGGPGTGGAGRVETVTGADIARMLTASGGVMATLARTLEGGGLVSAESIAGGHVSGRSGGGSQTVINNPIYFDGAEIAPAEDVHKELAALARRRNLARRGGNIRAIG